MRKRNLNGKYLAAATAAVLLAAALTACGTAATSDNSSAVSSTAQTSQTIQTSQETQTSENTQTSVSSSYTGQADTAAKASSADTALDTESLFTDRDLTQTADLSEAEYITVKDGENITITSAGTYVFTGTASGVTITVEAGDEDKVQLVLDGVSISNKDFPCIYVKNADKVFVTTTGTENSLFVTGTFTDDGTTNTDAVIFSKDDLVLNGTGTLNISSSDNGISCKDDLKITGGTYYISSQSDALEANDSVYMDDGVIVIKTGEDGVHVENDEDDTVGNFYMGGGSLTITAGDDAVHATTILQIDGGEINISAAEGLEATWVQINDGTISITASDDGINGAHKSSAYTPTIEINGGTITIDMGAGDTDAVDSNGNIYMNGGTLTITAQSAFDYDGTAEYNGGTIIVNGVQVNSITNQMMGGMGMQQGGFGGQPGDFGGQGGFGQQGGTQPGGNTGFGPRR
ncbi:MAG: carbohydrate-binding domain-containing protein [Eubacterium sp.]|nr:carbohydrate-binding domain-containing protein [Eubacterium sp.]